MKLSLDSAIVAGITVFFSWEVHYEPLWKWIKENGTDSFKLTFEEIEKIAGIPIDHSFLNYKKELLDYGFKVGKISLKEQTVAFSKEIPS